MDALGGHDLANPLRGLYAQKPTVIPHAETAVGNIQRYIEKKQKEVSNDETLDSAVIKTIREQGKDKKFDFK